MISNDDIHLAQLILGRNLISLPRLLEVISQITAQTTLTSALDQMTTLDKLTLDSLNKELSDAPPSQRDVMLQQGQTILLQHTRRNNTVTGPPPSHQKLDTQKPNTETRYLLDKPLGKGGMGQIWQSHDHVMQRTVAMKMLHNNARSSPAQQRQLHLEAQVTGKLQHPGIIPVYDLGKTTQSGPYYTMKIVKDPSLKILTKQIANNQRPYQLTKLTSIIRLALLALHYAHDHGVIHRDLKPANILVGAYGEVFIIDWGVAKVDNARLGLANYPPQIIYVEEGQLIGTPKYMSPEQAQGQLDRIDARTDIYAMGIILYELLTMEPFFTTNSIIISLHMASQGTTQRPSQRTPNRIIPQGLEDICMKALAHDPNDRYQSAAEMANDLELYQEGVKQRQQQRQRALATLQQANELSRALQTTKQALHHKQQQRNHLNAQIPSHAPPEQKAELWAIEQQCAELNLQSTTTFHSAVLRYQQALTHDPDNKQAKNSLAALFFAQLQEAEHTNNTVLAHTAQQYLQQYDSGQYQAYINGLGQLTIYMDTPPSVLNITLFRYEQSNIRLHPVQIDTFSQPPKNHVLKHGSYLLLIESPSYTTLRIPILIGRQQHLELPITMYPKTLIPEDMVIISGGDFLSGRIEAATIDKHTKHLDTFAIMRQPITCQDYLEYLNDRTWHDFDTALQHAPRLQVEQNAKVYLNYADDGLFSIPTEDAEGDAWHPLWPIALVNMNDVLDYANWLTNKTQINFRLPSMFEWEKAARGVDGRLYPWGNHFDAAFCNVRDSQRGRPMPVPVGSFTHDRSPYGVMDMAGNLAEWTSTQSQQTHIYYLRGASYASASSIAKLDSYITSHGDFLYPTYGFRLAFDLLP